MNILIKSNIWTRFYQKKRLFGILTMFDKNVIFEKCVYLLTDFLFYFKHLCNIEGTEETKS